MLTTLVVTSACSSDDASTGDQVDGDGSATTLGDGTMPAVSMPHGLGPPPTDADGSVPSTVLLPQSPLGPWSLEVESSTDFPPDGGPSASLTAARTSTGEGTQRLVFEFAGDTPPGWQVGYEAVPAGSPVTLVIRLTPASARQLDDAARRVDVDGGSPATTLELTSDADDLVTWTVGLDARVPFAVDTLPDPARLIIDLLATGT